MPQIFLPDIPHNYGENLTLHGGTIRHQSPEEHIINANMENYTSQQ